MSEDTVKEASPWPLRVKFKLVGSQDDAKIMIGPGITTLVGPNGSGKTRALREIKSLLTSSGRIESHDRKVHFLAAGRSSPFEMFRSSVDNPNYINPNDAAIGNIQFLSQW